MKTFYLPFTKTIILAAIFAVALNRSSNGAVTNYIWNVSNPSPSSTWNTVGNWLPATGYPGAGGDTADTVVFGSVGTVSSATSTDSVVSVNTTISTLNYTNIGGTFHVTDIPGGVILTVTNFNEGLADATATEMAMLDAGTLVVNGSMTIGAAETANATQVANFGGLSNFVFNASAGTMNLGPANDSIVNITLAGASNSVTAGTIDYNINASSSSSTTTFALGGGTNIINVGTFDLAY
ncbi:MAG TPA: hypothetical protein VK811_03030, partial [Candidatus Acidoferrum sp.]|nr:hypothetical protein [Candidatus Acidoferrum sp.]